MNLFTKNDKGLLLPGERVYKKFLSTAKYYINELDYYGPNQFKKVVEGSGWTMGQVYDHLINGTRAYHFREINNCLKHTNGDYNGEKRFKGKLVYMLGSFPPVKIKGVDLTGYVPEQPESPYKMKDEFYKFLKEMYKYSREIDAANSPYKTSHPSLGMLTAAEWFELIEMHFRHHIRQKKEIDKSIRSFTKETVSETAPSPYSDHAVDIDNYEGEY